jgi:amino acid adenylation domain-containing protein
MRVAAESEILVETLAPPPKEALDSEVALRLAADFAYAPFDIDHGPLLRLGVQPLPAGETRLVLAVHHLVCDFWSLALMFRDLGRLYAQECSAGESAERGQPCPPAAWPAPELRYSDWVRWQRERGAVQSDDAPPAAGAGEDPAHRALDFWRRELAGVPALDLPADRSRPPLPSYRGGRVTGLLPAPVAGRLRAVAAAAGVTPFSVLLAAFELQLERYSGQQRFAVGTPTAGRDAAGVREVVGYFVNPLPVVADLRAPPAGTDGQPRALSAAAALARTAAAARATLEHSRLALQELVERLGGGGRGEDPGAGPSARGRDASRAPIFQVMFVYQRPHLAGAASLAAAALGASGYPLDLGGLPLVTEALPERGAPFDLMLSVGELPATGETTAERRGGQIGLALQYSGDLYDPASAERMMGHYRILVTALVDALSAGGELPVAALPLLSQAERGHLLGSWSRPATVEVPADTMDGLVAAAAARCPEQPAVVSLAGTLTYRELEGRANQLAHALRRHGVRPEERVAVMLERTPSLIVALLATLKAGGLYVPIDPAYPPERQALILADSRARVVVTQDALAGAAESALVAGGASALARPALLRLDGDAALLAELPRTAPAPDPLSADPRRLAYLIYTSGSTGRPKGVAIEHASAVTMISWARTQFSPAELAGVLGATSVCFDLSVFEIFVTLASGGTLVLAKDALALAGPDAAALAALWPLTLINTVPSAIAVLVEAAAIPPSVTTVNLAGEPLKGELVRRVYASAPDVKRVLNLYGPSEDTTYSTWYSSAGAAERERLRAGGEPTIGVPIANSRGYVVDRQWRPQPAGVPGLLYLGGDGLARGYFDRPSLTAGRWLPDPFAGQVAGSAAGDRVYATGDLVRWLPNGQLEFLGRADHQVKIRGFRIELGEIEAALAAHAGVAEAVVVAREDRPGEPRLVCYWAPAESSGEAAAEGEEGSAVLRRYLGERLPEFMVPALFVQLPALPQTPNGKIDRRALPAPEPAAESEGLAPRTATEEALAAIWSDVLGVPRVGVRDHFFDLGGHSLLASRVASRIEAELGVQLALPELFAAPTVESLAQRVDEQLLAGADADQLEALLALLEEEPV